VAVNFSNLSRLDLEMLGKAVGFLVFKDLLDDVGASLTKRGATAAGAYSCSSPETYFMILRRS